MVFRGPRRLPVGRPGRGRAGGRRAPRRPLDGRPLGADHGAPVRLVSPAQYGYVSTKHLCRIEVHDTEPTPPGGSLVATRLLESHPRARVGRRSGTARCPGWLVRPVYRALKAPLLRLCARDERAHDERSRTPSDDVDPWRIHDIAPDFTVEDVWALPAHGDADEFPALLDVMRLARLPRSRRLSRSRVLWSTRDLLGRWFDLGRISGPSDGTADRRRRAADSRARTSRRSSTACRTICATRRQLEFGATPFCPSTAPTTSTPPSCRTAPCTACCTWRGSTGRRPLPRPDGRLRQAPRPVRAGRTWRSSSRSATGSSTRHSCDTSNRHGTGERPLRGDASRVTDRAAPTPLRR